MFETVINPATILRYDQFSGSLWADKRLGDHGFIT